MKTSHSKSRHAMAALMAAIALAFAATKPASAQHPTSNTWTAEGTEIKNKATASFTDARSNTYTDVESNEVTVTVGFRGSIAVLAVTTPLTFTQGSTDNTASFDVTNYGNGTDSVKFSFTNSNGSTFTGAQFCVPDGSDPDNTDVDTDPDCYASIAALRAAEIPFTSGQTIRITVHFDVASGSGGDTGTFTLAGNSGRDNTAVSDQDVIDLSVDLTGTISVTAGGPDEKVPTNYNGTSRLYYQAQFTVSSGLSGDDDVDIGAVIAGDADIEIIRVALCSATGTAITETSISYGGSASICVLYNIQDDATAADAATITLTATSQSLVTATDDDDYDITVIRPSLTLVKKAFLDDGTTEITTEEPKPGDYIIYEISVENTGAADAATVVISDVLPGEVTYDSYTTDAAGWTIDDTGAPTITGTLASLAAGDTRYFRIRVQIN